MRNQLEYEGYEQDEVDYAIENLDVDWNEQAAKSAGSYMEMTSFSKKNYLIN